MALTPLPLPPPPHPPPLLPSFPLISRFPVAPFSSIMPTSPLPPSPVAPACLLAEPVLCRPSELHGPQASRLPLLSSPFRAASRTILPCLFSLSTAPTTGREAACPQRSCLLFSSDVLPTSPLPFSPSLLPLPPSLFPLSPHPPPPPSPFPISPCPLAWLCGQELQGGTRGASVLRRFVGLLMRAPREEERDEETMRLKGYPPLLLELHATEAEIKALEALTRSLFLDICTLREEKVGWGVGGVKE
ncbi:unnamed protein product [Closterium sp. NIES-54]